MKLAKYSNILTLFFLFISLFAGFIMVNKNEYGFCNIGKTTYYLSDSKLYKLVNKDNLSKGDKIYYVDKDDLGYTINSDKLVYAGVANKTAVYVLKSRPDEVITDKRIVGKLSYTSPLLGKVFNVLSYKINFIVLIILPLILLLTYRFYNVISLPSERVPIKLGKKVYELPALRRTAITRRKAVEFTRTPIKKRYS